MSRASLVLRGGRVVSPSAPGGTAEAIAIDGDTIVAVGDNEAIDGLTSPETRVVNLAGRLAIPAFGDAHVHPISAGLESLRCDLLGVRDRKVYVERVAAHAAELPPEAWVLGGGWAMEAFPGGVPTAVDLDQVCGGRPAFLPNRDHHSAWVNSVALERAGVDASTPDPPAGRVERDERGQPTGALHDGAMSLVARILPPTSPEELADGLRAALKRLHGHGITHWQDACVGAASSLGMPDTFDTYATAMREGWLTARVRAALWWDRGRGLEQLTDFQGRREMAADGAFRAGRLEGRQETHVEPGDTLRLLWPSGHGNLWS